MSSGCGARWRVDGDLVRKVQQLERARELRGAMAVFTCVSLLVSCGYSFMLVLTRELFQGVHSSAVVTSPLALACTLGLLWMVKRSRSPASSRSSP